MTLIEQRKKEISDIILTDEEKEDALWEGKIKKWSHLKFGPYWEEREKVKPNAKNLQK